MKKNPGFKNKQRLKLNLFSLRLFFEEKNTPTYYRPCLKLLVSGQLRMKQCFGSGFKWVSGSKSGLGIRRLRNLVF
jgi:hypothetical protein